ncbi:uncharacterized protein [Cicer arietinum]|uniref:Uncharacterized protein LOC101495648 n=1 Tax=Cicer arietinum TaxID=3827 RepID=A0A1S2Z6L5_CICAR|nr:uncharacterized protein LOC101495648 [Cicer arietinum]
MGNCLWGAMSDPSTLIKVITSDNGIMEFYPPITVNFITNEFQNHAIFPNNDQFSKPLCQLDELVAGQSYYLMPLNNRQNVHHTSTSFAATSIDSSTRIIRQGHVDHSSTSSISAATSSDSSRHIIRQGHVRSQSVPTIPHPTPHRMSLDYQYYHGIGLLKRTSKESLSCRTNTSNYRSVNNNKSIGFWKVKLVITPEKLLEILSQEGRTKELIESVRIVAKCGVASVGGGGGCGVSSTTSIVPDQWSLSSSGRSAPSKIDNLVLDI